MADTITGLSDVDPVSVYEGSNSRGPFPIVGEGSVNILYETPSQIHAFRISATGAIAELVNGIDYTLTSTLDSPTQLYMGSLELTASQSVLAAADGDTPAERLVIYRESALDQSFTLGFNRAFPSQSFVQLQNRLVARLQESRATARRAILTPVGEGEITLPDRLLRKGKVLGGHPTTGAITMLTLGEASDADGVVILQEQVFEAEADQVDFVLENVAIDDVAALLVWVGGAVQPTSAYTVAVDGANTVLTLVSDPGEGVVVQVRVLGSQGVTDVGVALAMTPLLQGTQQQFADALEFAATGSTAERSLADRFAEHMSVLDFVTDVSLHAAIIAGTSVADVTTYVQAAIDWAYAAPLRRRLLVTGDFVCASDLANFHDVQMHGPGSFQVAGGPKWYAQANALNTGYGALEPNIIYVNAATGDDTNSGLSTSAAVETIQQAFDILATKGAPLPGYFNIVLAEGVYAPDASTWNIESEPGLPLLIAGPAVDAWDNSNPPDEPVAITAITAANPPVVTAAGHGRSNGDKVFIGFAAKSGGAHESDGAIYTVANVNGNDFELSGVNGSAWSAYTGSGRLYDCNGNAPKAIIYGAGANVLGLNCQHGDYLEVRYIHFIGCGTKAGDSNYGGIRFAGAGLLKTSNVHATDCATGVLGRDGGAVSVPDGRFFNCGKGGWAIHARYTFGIANPGSAALTTTAIFHDCTVGVDVWEMASGHADGAIFTDCNTPVYCRKNAQVAAVYNRFVNTTGSAVVGCTIEHGSHATIDTNNSTNSWSGSFRPRVRVRGYSTLNEHGSSIMSWLTRFRNAITAPTPAGGEATLMSLAIPQGQFTEAGQGIRVKLRIVGTWANGNVLIRLKQDSTTLYTHTDASNASVREISLEFDLMQNGFATARIAKTQLELISSTTPRFDHSGAAFDCTAANTTFTVTGEVAHASDSISILWGELETIGW